MSGGTGDNMELIERKQLRLENYDYSSAGVYFITICSKDKKPVFSRIVGGRRPRRPESSSFKFWTGY